MPVPSQGARTEEICPGCGAVWQTEADRYREALADLVAEFEAYAGQDAAVSGYYQQAKVVLG